MVVCLARRIEVALVVYSGPFRHVDQGFLWFIGCPWNFLAWALSCSSWFEFGLGPRLLCGRMFLRLYGGSVHGELCATSASLLCPAHLGYQGHVGAAMGSGAQTYSLIRECLYWFFWQSLVLGKMCLCPRWRPFGGLG